MASRSIDMRQRALWLLPLALSACAPGGAPPPATVPAPPVPPPAPVASSDWRDWPITPGTWTYLPGRPVSSARYGEGPAAQFVIQCDATAKRVTIMRAGTAAELSIIMSTRTARLPAGHIDDRGTAMSGVILNATDHLLDEMAFSRGRVAVQSPGLLNLVVPTWAEPARAVEDCRK